MMMTMDPSTGFNKTSSTNFNSDVDWSVFENADRYLLRDDSAWITRLSKDFWWNLERISEMTTPTSGRNSAQQIASTKPIPQQVSSMQINNSSARKIVGQRSTITRPNPNNIPEKTNYFSINDQDNEYNPFQSKISFDNNIWTNYFQQAVPWQ